MSSATDFDIAFLRSRRTNKWHKFPDDVLPAWVADMDFGVAPPIAEALARLARNQEYGYAARDGALALTTLSGALGSSNSGRASSSDKTAATGHVRSARRIIASAARSMSFC